MRWGALIIFAALTVGCAAQKPVAENRYPIYREPAASGSLAFDPPIARYTPPIDLSRDVRERAAFVGYDELSTTFYNIYTDDKQYLCGPDNSRYQRRAISERVGISYR